MNKNVVVVVALLALLACCSSPPTHALAGFDAMGGWRLLATPNRASLRGLAVVDANTAWVSGHAGAIWRTIDGGATWTEVAPPDTSACDFRDVHAFDANVALAMVAGTPARVYRTADGGGQWQLVHADAREQAFFDALAFAGGTGLLFGDPLDGAFCLWTSRDAGLTWMPVPREQVPMPLVGEAAFAASGTCVAVTGEPGAEQFWIATGGGERARLLRSGADGWTTQDVPLRTGSASRGGFGLAVRGQQVVLVGGDYAEPRASAATAARSDDAGSTWTAAAGGAGGFRSAAVWLDDTRVLAVGSHGTSLSLDAGRTWTNVDPTGFHCVARGADGSVWACGSDGRVARWRD